MQLLILFFVFLFPFSLFSSGLRFLYPYNEKLKIKFSLCEKQSTVEGGLFKTLPESPSELQKFSIQLQNLSHVKSIQRVDSILCYKKIIGNDKQLEQDLLEEFKYLSKNLDENDKMLRLKLTGLKNKFAGDESKKALESFLTGRFLLESEVLEESEKIIISKIDLDENKLKIRFRGLFLSVLRLYMEFYLKLDGINKKEAMRQLDGE